METTHTVLQWGLPHIQTIHLYASLPSTNTSAKDQIFRGCVHGTVVWALEQTAGRGRRGRPWFSDSTSLTFSVIWRLPDYAKAGLLPLALGLGLVRELQVYSPQVKLKWPNDLWAGERKLGGILCESTKHQGEIWVVAGVGLNINRPMQAPDIPAVSLAECCGVPLTRFEVLTLALAGANAALARLLADDVEWSEEFERFGNFLHRSVYLLAQGKAWRAIPRQVLPDGRLLVEAEDGSLRAVLAEEVSLRPVGHYQSGEYREGDKNRGDKTN